jgi:stearoyl-CoA desaturase (Delta-9 desaturase)
MIPSSNSEVAKSAVKRPVDWVPFLFLTLTPIAGLVLIPVYFYLNDVNPWIVALAVTYLFLSGVSITGGYHRLFAHRAYDGSYWLKCFYLFFGAAAFQNSALVWSINHRQHHRKVDTDDDPYSIKKGAFFAHMGWMLFKNPAAEINEIPTDLEDPLVQFQHKYYYPIAFFSGFIVPGILGLLFQDFWGGFLLIGLARMVVLHHTTFFVNSLAHIWGHQPYTDTNTAKDNFVVALLTYGEGYHNFHHFFEADYRNGVRWYQFDPTKWFIRFMSWLGQARNLKRISTDRIILAKMTMQKKRLQARGLDLTKLEQIRQRFAQVQARLKTLQAEYESATKERLAELRLEIQLAKIEARAVLQQWRVCLREQYAMSYS